MKITFLIFIVLFCFVNCTVKKHYLSTLENIKVFPPTKEEAIIIEKLELKSKEFLEKCKRDGNLCIDDDPFNAAHFKTGVTGFRKNSFRTI